MPDAHLRVFRGSPGEEGRFDEFDVPGRGGDGRPRCPPLDPGPRGARPRRPLELQGGQVRLVQRRGRRPAAADLQDPPVRLRPRRADHRRADARLPAHPRPRHRRLLELRGQQDDPAVHAARRRPAGGLALAAAGHRAGPGIPQVHRVLPVPGRLPCPAQPRDREAVHGSALSSSGRPGSRCTRSTRPTGASTSRTAAGSATATSPSAAPRSVPEHIKITDNAIIPLKERVADAYYDPIQWAWRKLRGESVTRRRAAAGRAAGPPGRSATARRRPSDRADVPEAADASE